MPVQITYLLNRFLNLQVDSILGTNLAAVQTFLLGNFHQKMPHFTLKEERS